MTKEELQKRLKYIEAKPVKAQVAPRETSRRDINTIENKDEYEISEFDSFFEFEKDIAELESARKQMEKLEAAKLKSEQSEEVLNTNNEDFEEESESFLIFEEDEDYKSGDESSFFTFEESDDEESVDEELVDTSSSNEETDETQKEVESNEKITTPDNQDGEVFTKTVSKKGSYTEVKGFEFKYCQYIKSNGEQCKRQAPKGSDYCGTHRKLLAKQSS